MALGPEGRVPPNNEGAVCSQSPLPLLPCCLPLSSQGLTSQSGCHHCPSLQGLLPVRAPSTLTALDPARWTWGLPCTPARAVGEAQMDKTCPPHPRPRPLRSSLHTELKPAAPASLVALSQTRGKAQGAHAQAPLLGGIPGACP